MDRHKQALRKCGEIQGSRRRRGAIPGIDDVSAWGEDCGPADDPPPRQDRWSARVEGVAGWRKASGVVAIQQDHDGRAKVAMTKKPPKSVPCRMVINSRWVISMSVCLCCELGQMHFGEG